MWKWRVCHLHLLHVFTAFSLFFSSFFFTCCVSMHGAVKFGLGWSSLAVLLSVVSRFLARLFSRRCRPWNRKIRPYRCSRLRTQGLSKVLSFNPAVHQNIALHVSSTLRNLILLICSVPVHSTIFCSKFFLSRSRILRTWILSCHRSRTQSYQSFFLLSRY